VTRGALMQIVAHRGASIEAPENTLAAFAKAIEVGADMIEFDVRRAPDGRLVISHDPVRVPAPVPCVCAGSRAVPPPRVRAGRRPMPGSPCRG